MNSFTTINGLIDTLFEAEDRRKAKTIFQLNHENKKIKGLAVDGFIYNGNFYVPQEGTITISGGNVAKSTLDLSLQETMEDWLKENQILTDEKAYIRQVLVKVLAGCITLPQIRNALPECLVSCVKELSKFPRTDEAAYTIKHDPRAMRQYLKILPKIEFYSVTRLIY